MDFLRKSNINNMMLCDHENEKEVESEEDK